jgi:hypothetical protein
MIIINRVVTSKETQIFNWADSSSLTSVLFQIILAGVMYLCDPDDGEIQS